MMKEPEMKELLIKIGKEELKLGEMIKILEVSQNSVKREKYCKKREITYDEYIQIYKNVRGFLFAEYPIFINVMETVINNHKSIRKEYDTLANEVLKKLNEEYDASKKGKTSQIDEMEKLLKDLKKQP